MSRQEIWDFWAKAYESLWVQKYSLEPTRGKILQYLREYLDPDKAYRILDIGCGTGQLLREIRVEFSGYKLELLGIDYSKQMVKVAEEHGGGIDYQQMNVSQIGNILGKFDIIICTHSFPYYEDQAKAIVQINGLLDVGGYLLLAQASQNNLYDGIAMFFVKLTTGKAKYLSVKEVQHITEECFQCEDLIKIKESPYMPSIYFFILAKREFKGDYKG
ncbi:MAG: hypothetical protein APF76_00855 [Desulfitibacter sp. BRH_c19]|nr:MAG: hypothetical protein APF76_00855 [Desulfitibacter sp. BRH_c19]